MDCASRSKIADVYVENGRVVKLFKEHVPKKRVLGEALNHTIVEEANINVPALREISLIDGRWALIMDYVEGQTYNDLIFLHPNKKDELMEEFVDIQIEIHVTKVEGLDGLYEKLSSLVNSIPELDDINKYELLARLEGMPKHTKLCHMNYNLNNVIRNEKGVWILDWENALLGNASADVANTYLILRMQNEDLAELYLSKFCEFTCTPRTYIQKWLPIVAASMHGRKDKFHDLINVVEYY